MRYWLVLLPVLLFLVPIQSVAELPQPGAKWNENNWSEYLADRMDGTDQFRTDDGSWVDVLTVEKACEVDWAHKWQEGVGQALFYGIQTERRPCLILLVTDVKRDAIYIHRANIVCERYKILLQVEYADGKTKAPVSSSAQRRE